MSQSRGIKKLFVNFLVGFGATGVVIATVLTFAFVVFAGPIGLGYSLKHLLPYAIHHAVAPWAWPACVGTIIVGWLTASISVPLGLVTWLLVLLGVLA